MASVGYFLFDRGFRSRSRAGTLRSEPNSRTTVMRRPTRYVVYVESRSTGFEAYVPDVPGCVASGETREQALARIRRNLEAHDDGMRSAAERLSRRNRAPSELVTVNLA
jgi:predicted RNase H-like HicB family nuclease